MATSVRKQKAVFQGLSDGVAIRAVILFSGADLYPGAITYNTKGICLVKAGEKTKGALSGHIS